jgi:hypothetical protein
MKQDLVKVKLYKIQQNISETNQQQVFRIYCMRITVNCIILLYAFCIMDADIFANLFSQTLKNPRT